MKTQSNYANVFIFTCKIYRSDFLNGIVDIQLAPNQFINLVADNKDGYRIRLTFRAYGNGHVKT